MKVNMKHVVEIAGGLFLGALASDAFDGVVKFTKGVVVKVKTKKGKGA